MTRRLQPLRGQPTRAQVVKAINWVAPVDGWRTDVAWADLPPNAASTLQNFFPEPGYTRVRNGSVTYATGLGAFVGTLIPYMGAANKLFAITPTALYEVTGGGAVGAALVSSLTNSHWSWTQFTNVGGTWLLACNGVDPIQKYDGTTWSAATFTGGPTNLNTLSVVTAYRDRLYFIEGGTCRVWFGVTDGITGALQSINVGANMKYGGVLVALTSWTTQTSTGVVQFLAMISSNGEVVIYQGSDPTNASNWSLMGTFKMSAPVGADRCCYQVGADVAIMTMDGIVPLSQAMTLTPAASDQQSMTKKIAPTWLSTMQSVGANALGWELCLFPPRRMAIVNVPDPLGTYQYVMNTETLSWCQFNGMAATTWCVWNNLLFFGTSAGTIVQADYGSTDLGAPIVALSVGAWTRLTDGLSPKSTTLIGVDALVDGNARILAGASFDYATSIPSGIGSSGGVNAAAQWDVAVWDVDVWPGSSPSRLVADASGMGVVFAPTIQAQISGQPGEPTACQIFGGAIHVQQGMSGL